MAVAVGQGPHSPFALAPQEVEVSRKVREKTTALTEIEARIGFERIGDGPEALDELVLGEMDIPHDINRRRWRRRGRAGLGHSTLLWVQEPGGAAKGAEAGSHGGAKLRDRKSTRLNSSH